MWRKLIGAILGVACLTMVAGVADAAAKKHARKGTAKPKESMETMIRRAVDDAIKDSLPAASGKFEFAAKRMRPPKNNKWTKRWNEMGQDGWQLVGSNENIYIFQRPGHVDLAAANTKKADKAAAADSKKANKEAEKAAKEADKQAKKAAKEAEKAAKKAAKTQ